MKIEVEVPDLPRSERVVGLIVLGHDRQAGENGMFSMRVVGVEELRGREVELMREVVNLCQRFILKMAPPQGEVPS